MESFMRWRWVLLGLSVLLAVVLIANGNVLIGGLIGVMAVVRDHDVLQDEQSPRRATRRTPPQYPAAGGYGKAGRVRAGRVRTRPAAGLTDPISLRRG